MSVYSGGGGGSGGRNRKRSLRQDLKRVEHSIYELELSYFQQVTKGGNAFEGWYSEPRPAKRQQQPAGSDEEDEDERSNGVDPEIVEKMFFSKSSLSSPWYEKHSSCRPQRSSTPSSARRQS